MPSGGNIIPRLYQELFIAGRDGNQAEAERLQQLTDSICQTYQKGFTLGQSLAALKVMMGTMQLCGPAMLPPLTRLSAADEERVKRETANVL